MGASMHVVAFKPPDEKWERMRAAYTACEDAGVDPPREVDRYFGDEPPDPRGVEIPETALRAADAVTEWQDGMRQGYEIDVAKLPPDATIVRVYMSY